MNSKNNKDFVKTYNIISSAIEGLINNNDMDEKTNRRYIAGYIIEQMAKNGLLKDTVNMIDFDAISWNVDGRSGKKMKDFDGITVDWQYNK